MHKKINMSTLRRKCMHKTTIMFFSCLAVLSGCGLGTNTNDVGNLVATPSSHVTINSAGIIPVFNRMQTTTKIQVHNNSSIAIAGIKYTVNNTLYESTSANQSNTLNTTESNPNMFSIDQISANKCSTIVAYGSCDLIFTTPIIDDASDSGSALITASYSVNGNSNSFNQILNYKLFSSNQQGVNVSSGLSINTFGNSTGYGTIYAYVNDSDNSS